MCPRRGWIVTAAIALGFFAVHAASAQSGLYISGGAGAALMPDYSRDVTIRVGGVSGPGTNTTTYNTGESVNAAVGYHLPLGFRIEGEFGYQHYTTDSISPFSSDGQFPPINGTRLTNPSGGDHNVLTGTANLFYDLPVTFAGFTPYIGGGGGYYHAGSTNAVFFDPVTHGPFTSHAQDGGGGMVLGEAGVSYHVMPNLSLTVAYRYEHFFHPPVGTDAAGNIVKLGLRYDFGAPPPAVPPPMPVAAPAPSVAASRSFLVFFDWDKATLTDRARQIIAEAAASSTHVQYTRIEVNGYTDTSGTPAYNHGLSERRARVVAAELVRDSVPQAAISIQGFGETHLLVPTGPGVREPQNRRVEIIIR